jgi:DNA-binding NarL/FixJ family response regulator
MHTHRGMPSVERGRASSKEGSHEHRPRVLVFGALLAPDHEAVDAFGRLSYDVVPCADHHALLEAMVQRSPAAVVFELRGECPQDLGVLHLVRRALPRVPLIVVADSDSLDLRRRIQALQPTYFAVRPLEADEVAEALTDALHHTGSLH